MAGGGGGVQGPWRCPCSTALLMVNVAGHQRSPPPPAISAAIGPRSRGQCTLLPLFVCILDAPPWPPAPPLPPDTRLLPRLSPSHPDSGFVGDTITRSTLA